MKYLLLSGAVLGLLYIVFIDSKKAPNNDDRPEVIYQREVDKVQAIEGFLQETVDQQREELDKIQ
ncbi:MAG: hypothetical protein KBT53_03485 [Porticoccus sp.]|nr:hypothetical protein [Porticoccus sp.]MBQ0807054.1 hypothetical protein [Porticoccus sp.]